jgi:ribonucrease Y
VGGIGIVLVSVFWMAAFVAVIAVVQILRRRSHQAPMRSVVPAAVASPGPLGVQAPAAQTVFPTVQAPAAPTATAAVRVAAATALPPISPISPPEPVDTGLLLRRAREAAEAEIVAIRADIREQRLDLERREHRLTEREERLDTESHHLEDRASELADHHAELDSRQAELNARRAELGDLEEQRRLVLERAAGLSAQAARAQLVAAIENQARRDAAVLTREIEREAQIDGELRARRIITGAIQRLATEQTSESVVSVLHLPSDDMKGRIIGREGRNIRTFEAVTGVNLIIDDTPEAVLLSCFDPVRREVGRIALEALVLDGRIHPQRIEDAHARARVEVEALCVRAGEDALVDVGITEMHHELVAMLGRLRYRTSYGQNVLKHLLESAHIAGMMASELGLDPALMRRCALLHDVGKALTHEVEGSHAIIGAEVARKYGENDDVVHAIEAHHNEVEPHTLEAVLTQAADAISGGRPGARRESLEAYVKRLERLEEIGMAYEGVEKVFAMQAGREVRVMVLPDAVDDIQAQVIAREIAKQVEHELSYPGQIRVTVVRESRATEVAR